MSTFKHVLSDAEIDEMRARNKARIEAAQQALGHKWLLAKTRLPQPTEKPALKAVPAKRSRT
jgi:hypothetical protein